MASLRTGAAGRALTLSAAALALLAGCDKKHDHGHDDHDHGAAPAASAALVEGVSVPADDPVGPAVQAKTVLQTPAVKLVSIRIRKGATLPEHTAPNPVLITAVSGSGAITAQGKRLPVSPGRLVSLGAGVPHDVVPDEGAELVLLVHHQKGASGR